MTNKHEFGFAALQEFQPKAAKKESSARRKEKEAIDTAAEKMGFTTRSTEPPAKARKKRAPDDVTQFNIRARLTDINAFINYAGDRPYWVAFAELMKHIPKEK